MQYMGSKNRISKYLLPTMIKERESRPWVEPFVGGANMIDKVDGIRIGNDTNEYLIALLIAVRDGWIPPTDISKEFYYDVKNNKDKYSKELVGFVGFLCSFGSKWFGGYAFNNSGTNYAASGSKSLVKQSKNLLGIDFRCMSYLELDIPANSLIYCDPPYENTTNYKDKFDHVKFWQWCRERSLEGHIVFVSEYSSPGDFVCVQSIETSTVLDKNKKYKRIEKLFRYNV